MRILTWNVQWFRGLDGVVDVRRVVAHALDWGDAPDVVAETQRRRELRAHPVAS